MKDLRYLLISFLFLGYMQSNAQLSVGLMANHTHTKITLGYDFSPRIWLDLRVYSNTTLSDIIPELAIHYNIKNKDQFRSYIGVAAIMDYWGSIVVPLGIQLMPVQGMNNLAFLIEFSPAYDFHFDEPVLRAFGGVRYTF